MFTWCLQKFAETNWYEFDPIVHLMFKKVFRELERSSRFFGTETFSGGKKFKNVFLYYRTFFLIFKTKAHFNFCKKSVLLAKRAPSRLSALCDLSKTILTENVYIVKILPQNFCFEIFCKAKPFLELHGDIFGFLGFSKCQWKRPTASVRLFEEYFH